MPLPPRTVFGPYEVGELIGVGGMGEVYRATDVNLGREVALKMLPRDFLADADRIARLDREARTLATLNHPNIAQIHGLETANGARALVMELVEGPTLAERIQAGPVPPDEALDIALQIASALDAAHRAGIVHRDLKPANIKLTGDGTVKVLDFGIAKTVRALGASRGNLPATTVAGFVIGTAAYMSPEQARGVSVDQRTDIWAFGCVLYELLTGDRAFEGDETSATRAERINGDNALDRLPATVTPGIRTALKLCLESDLDKRMADIRDVRLVLQGKLGGPPANAAIRPSWWGWLVPIAAGLATAGVLGFVTWNRGSPEPQPVARFSIPIGNLLGNQGLAISRDGRRIVFRSRAPWELQVREVAEFESRVLAGTVEDLPLPCLSPDGASVAYVGASNSQLKRVAVAGGSPLVIASDLDFGGSSCHWAENGYLYFPSLPGISRVPEQGGIVEVVIAAPSDEVQYNNPFLLPDGHSLMFTASTDDGTGLTVLVRDLQSQSTINILDQASNAQYLPLSRDLLQGYLAFTRERGLFAGRFDVARRALGPTTRIIDGAGNFAVSENGTLAYLSTADVFATTFDADPAGVGGGYTLAWLGRDGAVQPLPNSTALHGAYSVANDGTTFATSVFTAAGGVDLWIYDADDARLMRLTFGGSNTNGINTNGIFTPDGASLIYMSAPTFRARARELRVMPTDGGTPRTIARFDSGIGIRPPGPTSIRFDGSAVLGVRDTGANNTGDVWIAPLSEAAGGPVEIRPLLATRFDERGAVFSPDGRYIGYSSNESGQNEVYVVSYPALDGKWQISRGGGVWPQWNANGRELFYQNGSRLMVTDVDTSTTFRADTPKILLDAPDLLRYDTPVAVGADGSRFLVHKPATEQGESLRVVINWIEELEQLVP